MNEFRVGMTRGVNCAEKPQTHQPPASAPGELLHAGVIHAPGTRSEGSLRVSVFPHHLTFCQMREQACSATAT